MNLSLPTKPAFIIFLVLFVITMIIFFAPTLVPEITQFLRCIVIVGWGLLIAGNLIKGL